MNGVTGDYSRGAVGLWIENGELAYPVEEVTVAGNLLEMLAAIDGVGDDLVLRDRTVAPDAQDRPHGGGGNLIADTMVIDSHCHLHDPAFADLQETLRLSLAHDVWGAIAVGCDPRDERADPRGGRRRAEGGLGVPGIPSRPDPISPTKISIASRRRSPRTTRGSWDRRDRPALVLARGRAGPGRRSWRGAASGSVGCSTSPRAGIFRWRCTRRTALPPTRSRR